MSGSARYSVIVPTSLIPAIFFAEHSYLEHICYAFSHTMAYFPFAKEIPAKLLSEQEVWRRAHGSALVDVTVRKYPDSSTCQGRRDYERELGRQAKGQGREGLDVSGRKLYTAWYAKWQIVYYKQVMTLKGFPMNMLSFLLPWGSRTEQRDTGKTSLIGCDSEELVTGLTFPHCGFESLLSKGLL